MRDELADLVRSNAVVERPLEVALELLGAVESNQCCARDYAAIALRQSRALPNVTEEHLFGEVYELGDGRAHLFTVGRRRSWLDCHGHTYLDDLEATGKLNCNGGASSRSTKAPRDEPNPCAERSPVHRGELRSSSRGA